MVGIKKEREHTFLRVHCSCFFFQYLANETNIVDYLDGSFGLFCDPCCLQNETFFKKKLEKEYMRICCVFAFKSQSI